MSALPSFPVVLIGVATALVWLLFLLVLFAAALEGNLFGSLSAIFATGGLADNPAMRTALAFQWIAAGVQLLVILLLGTITLVFHAMGDNSRATGTAILFVRCLIVFELVAVLVSVAMPLAVSQSILLVLPVLAVSLPFSIAIIAFLVCADRFLRNRTAEVFS
ncbi:MAG: hypothetical protein AB8B85_20955 [Paracoccaceae bacterium]